MKGGRHEKEMMMEMMRDMDRGGRHGNPKMRHHGEMMGHPMMMMHDNLRGPFTKKEIEER